MAKQRQQLSNTVIAVMFLTGLFLHIHVYATQSLAQNRLVQPQVTQVEQFRDVSSTDRYYKSLKRLVERYQLTYLSLYECPFIDVKSTNCQVPLFRANTPLLRRDFVMILNQGLDRLNELIAAPFGNPLLSTNDVEVIASQWNKTRRSLEQELTQIETRLTQLERKVRS